MSWVPLESNPEVMTKFLHELGVPKSWGLVDVYGLDKDLLAMLPQPVLAIILLYPISQKTEDFKTKLESKCKESSSSKNQIYHMTQYVSNSCGTIALIHSVANNLNKIQLETGYLKTFLDNTKDMDSSERGQKLMEMAQIGDVHEDFAQEGQTEAPSANEKVSLHFIAFVEIHGSIYELDGRKPYPINHGPCNSETFLENASRVCQEYMNCDPDDMRFTLMALTVNN